MIIYRGKAKHLTFEAILWAAFWVMARPAEKLEAADFNRN